MMAAKTTTTKPPAAKTNENAKTPSAKSKPGAKKAFREKTPAKPNGSILNFFKKAEDTADNLFIQTAGVGQKFNPKPIPRHMSRSTSPSFQNADEDLYGDDESRYNESGKPNKRRKSNETTPDEEVDELFGDAAEAATEVFEKDGPQEEGGDDAASVPCTPPPDTAPTPVAKAQPRRLGAFIDDTDDEDEPPEAHSPEQSEAIQQAATTTETVQLHDTVAEQPQDQQTLVETDPIKQEDIEENVPVLPSVGNVGPIPALKHEGTSYGEDDGIGALFDDEEAAPADGDDEDEDFIEEEYADGEEWTERKWQEEQERFEREGLALGMGIEGSESASGIRTGSGSRGSEEPACPICSAKLGGISEAQATEHVNACLDGKPIPLPTPTEAPAATATVRKEVKREDSEEQMMPRNGASRFNRAAIARPAQKSPFDLADPASTGSTAFSKLMASKAEDAAWADAAAADIAARGKPAYDRTCPFYKIMPGFYICVDAFRYGKVADCNAYFLSHFHSDHYIGLTSRWCHGPIYCSKVTANLVIQQLKVDPKYVIALEWERKGEVPGTKGVSVTMIPANHCPGSSLFLFEKTIGRGPNPKIQRILHCGDFRACPAHVSHPKLMPDIVDRVTGKTRQQKIDVCYLDTTYLNPKYAFPSQEDVIRACGDMCASLSKEIPSEADAWEKVKRERAGAGMAKFVEGGAEAAIKTEDAEVMGMEITTSKSTSPETKPKPRGKLLVVCGTYSIGKERICLGIARALDCKIWAPKNKQRICAALEDPELMERMTDDPLEAQIHMQMIMEIRAETLSDYLQNFKPHFSRVVGFRPSGWNYRPPNSRFVESPSISTVLHSENWRSRYSMRDLVPQRGSTREAACFGVPYSEHSSFRELTMFCCALRIGKVVPTVNVGSAGSRAKMKGWIERWEMERRKNGVVKFGEGKGLVKW
jgi:DNA cross-link repair 1A protein